MKIIEGGLQYQAGKIAIVAARFNDAIVDGLLEGVLQIFTQYGVPADAVECIRVPGAFELPFASQQAAQSGEYVAVLALGAVIKGETAHFEYICDAATNGLMQVGLAHDIPVIYGLLTTYDLQQAQVRADITAKNKGAEVGEALLEMAGLKQAMSS